MLKMENYLAQYLLINPGAPILGVKSQSYQDKFLALNALTLLQYLELLRTGTFLLR